MQLRLKPQLRCRRKRIAGVMLPLFSIVFGDFTNAFGFYLPPCLLPPGVSPPPGFRTSEQFMAMISGIALNFTYLAIGACFEFKRQCVTVCVRERQCCRQDV